LEKKGYSSVSDVEAESPEAVIAEALESLK